MEWEGLGHRPQEAEGQGERGGGTVVGAVHRVHRQGKGYGTIVIVYVGKIPVMCADSYVSLRTVGVQLRYPYLALCNQTNKQNH
jgi:hypothetical protein